MEIHEVNLINHVSLDSCCRTCMNESENMRSLLYDNNDAGRSLSDVLSFVASIQVKENDKLPKQICERCVSNAQAACSFKELCQKTESTLKEAIRRDIFRKDIGGGSEMRREISLQAHMSMADDFDEPLVKNEFEVDEVKLNGDFFPYNVSCHICFKMFKTKQELQKHTENLHSCFQCSECGVKYTSESDLVKHLYADHNFSEVKPVVKLDVDSKIISDPIKCDNCNEIFATRKTFSSHRKRCKKHKTLKRSKRIKKEIVVESDDSLSDSPLHNLIRSPKDGSEFDSNDFKSESMSSLDQDDSELVEQEPQSNNLSLCLSCGLTFKSERAYKIHAGRKHGIGRRTKSVKRKANLSGASEFKCFCLQKFNSLHELQVHTCDKTDLDLSKPPDPFPCTMCERKFLKKSSLDSHLKRHEMQANEVHTCSICKREFKRKAHLNNHMLTHSADHGFKCDSCSKTFASQESLDVHLASHKGSKKHQCSFCDKGFNMLSTLKDHIRTHTGEKPFLCSICGRGFSQGTNLKEHLRRHQGLKLFKCPQCTHTFVSKGELEAHLRKHSGAHPFVCDVCGSGFTTSSSLVKHKRIHTGERPYSCEFCSMSFTALGTLKNHRRTHTGEKPYKCTFCVKAFVQKNDLVSHTRTHTGERPYVCTTCGHAFRQSSALKSHLKMHLGISERSTMRQNDVAFTLTRGESTLSMSPVEALITMRPGETILTLRPADDSPMDTAPSDTVSLQQEGDVASDSIITVLPLCKTSPVEIA